MWLVSLLLSLIILPVSPVSVERHDEGQSYVYFRIYDDGIDVILEVTANDLNKALGLDIEHGKGVPMRDVLQDVLANRGAIFGYLNNNFYLGTPDGTRLEIEFDELDLIRTPLWGDFIRFKHHVSNITEVPSALTVEFSVIFELDSRHTNFVLVEHNWKSTTFNNEAGISLILSPGNPRQVLDLSSSTVWTGFVGMVKFGIEHILLGFDHILFLIALLLPTVLYRQKREWLPVETFRTAFMNVLVIVSFFTLAHTITLSLAALDVVRLPSVLVESIIALSIAAAAIHNLNPRFIKHEWTIAFAFGLFHGFGFATLLEPLQMGREFIVLTLLGFNVGVEVGQVLIISIFVPILFLIRKKKWYELRIVRIGSYLLIAVALFWFIERVFDPEPLAQAKEAVKDVLRPSYYALRDLFS